MKNLGLGLDLQQSQLLPQPGHRLTQLAEAESHKAVALGQACPVETDLAGEVHQPVEQVTPDPDLRHRGRGSARLLLPDQGGERASRGCPDHGLVPNGGPGNAQIRRRGQIPRTLRRSAQGLDETAGTGYGRPALQCLYLD